MHTIHLPCDQSGYANAKDKLARTRINRQPTKPSHLPWCRWPNLQCVVIWSTNYSVAVELQACNLTRKQTTINNTNINPTIGSPLVSSPSIYKSYHEFVTGIEKLPVNRLQNSSLSPDFRLHVQQHVTDMCMVDDGHHWRLVKLE